MTTLDDRPTLPPVDPRQLPRSCRTGPGVRIRAGRLSVGENVTIGAGTTLVGDDVVLGDGTVVGPECDLRAGTLSLGPGSELGPRVRVLAAERFAAGGAARIGPDAQVLCREFTAGRLLYFGDGARVGYGGTTTSTSRVKIGDRVTVGQHTILNANHEISLGDGVGTGSYLAVWTHGYHFGHGPLDGTEPAYAPVHVARDVWLGYHVTLLPGAHVGEGTIVAAGSVVTAPLPAGILAGGVPARVKRELHLGPVADDRARDAVLGVLDGWRTELEWKGCTVDVRAGSPGQGLPSGTYEGSAGTLTVALADGTHRTRVVLLAPDDPWPGDPPPGQALAVLSLGERPDRRPRPGDPVALFELRSGRLSGHASPVVEDLRDRLRRHAMPCGDDRCFSSIEPAAFARLKEAAG
ncbi:MULTISPECIES: DapH/DapD/GlmU-related protein [unclassified Streptomyces]|uniref:DapH/DapD/GlmU-related protein n=1 Tax=unclassified Streptomyces TaxID=2593676 RepID=UPI0019089440|nr:DapH/DapD/GlmU-related protein [Streptomyces sp. HSG2]